MQTQIQKGQKFSDHQNKIHTKARLSIHQIPLLPLHTQIKHRKHITRKNINLLAKRQFSDIDLRKAFLSYRSKGLEVEIEDIQKHQEGHLNLNDQFQQNKFDQINKIKSKSVANLQKCRQRSSAKQLLPPIQNYFQEQLEKNNKKKLLNLNNQHQLCQNNTDGQIKLHQISYRPKKLIAVKKDKSKNKFSQQQFRQKGKAPSISQIYQLNAQESQYKSENPQADRLNIKIIKNVKPNELKGQNEQLDQRNEKNQNKKKFFINNIKLQESAQSSFLPQHKRVSDIMTKKNYIMKMLDKKEAQQENYFSLGQWKPKKFHIREEKEVYRKNSYQFPSHNYQKQIDCKYFTPNQLFSKKLSLEQSPDRVNKEVLIKLKTKFQQKKNMKQKFLKNNRENIMGWDVNNNQVEQQRFMENLIFQG